MDVNIGEGYITLGQLLKKLSIVSSGGEVKIYLENEPIFVNGEPENRRGRKLYPNDRIQFGEDHYVLRK